MAFKGFSFSMFSPVWAGGPARHPHLLRWPHMSSPHHAHEPAAVVRWLTRKAARRAGALPVAPSPRLGWCC